MSQPQDPTRRKHEKARRTKKLANWRAKQAAKPAAKPAAKKG